MEKIKIIIIILSTMFFASAAPTEIPQTTDIYFVPGTYSDYSEIVTEDGNAWGYDSEMENGEYMVVFSDNGTPENIYDDEILELIAR